jgi:hypothetical protein
VSVSEEEKKFDVKDMMVEGCIIPEAKAEISQMLSRRLAELDPEGNKAKFIMKLREEIDNLPDCSELMSEGESGTE